MMKNYNFNKYSFRITTLILIVLSFLCVSGIQAQNVGDYRSNTSLGNWTSLNSWQRYDGTNWVTPTLAQGYPGQFAGTGAVTISSDNIILANFITATPQTTIQISVIGINNNNPFTAYTTPNPIGIITVQSTAILALQGSGTGSINYTTYLKTSEIDVNSGGQIYFSATKVSLALPANGVIEVCAGGITGTSTNANQDIYIGNQWYAVGNSNQTQFTFDEIMTGCIGTLDAEIGYTSPVCIGNSINLTGSVTGVIGTTPTYTWSVISPDGITTTYTNQQNISLTALEVGIYTAKLTVTTTRNGYIYTNSKTVTITVLPNASLALTSGAATTNQTVCINKPLTNITYTATASTGVTFSGLPAGVTGTYSGGVVTISGMPTVDGTFNYTVTASGYCLSAQQSGTIKSNQSYWVGTVSSVWDTEENWTCGIPPAGADVVFAATTNSYGSMAVRDLHLDINRTIGSLVNASDKNLIIKPATTLVINNTAPANDNPAKIQILAAPDNVNGSLIFTNPLSNPNVNATVQMYTTGYRGATQWTWIDPDGKPYSGYYRWQYFGVPVESTSTLVSNTSLWGSYIRKYNESLELNKYYQKWSDLGNYDRLYSFNGYEITQGSPKIISFSGKLVTGNCTLTLSRSEVAGTKNYGSGYNIFGNSFTAAIDISKMVFGNGVQQTVYLYNTGNLQDWGSQQNISGNNAGAYYAIPANTAPAMGSIPSMQGFLLITGTNGSTVTIPYNSVTSAATANTSQQRVRQKISASEELSRMTVDVTGENGFDRVWIFSQPGTTHGFDNGWDGEKILQTNGVALYAEEENRKYQVSTTENLENTWLTFQAGTTTDYTLTINKSSLKDNKNIILFDSIANTIINLSDSITVYPFVAFNNGSPEKRFVFKMITDIRDFENNKSVKLKAFTANNAIKIQNLTEENATYSISDEFGVFKFSGAIGPKSTISPNIKFESGVYFVFIKTKNQNIIEKVIIK
ncbi:MAG: hypothetical protein H6Q19_550 [Bacteroidetes bacterium]|nr:hypothetical protein [Bacteroidota bacterium]